MIASLQLRTKPELVRILVRQLRTSPVSLSAKTIDDIPGPKGLPLLGTALEYSNRRKDGFSLDKFHLAAEQRCRQYGPIYKEKIGPKTLVIITDYVEFSKVLHVEGKYPVRELFEPMRIYYKLANRSLGMLTSGEDWYEARSHFNKKMLRPTEVIQFLPEMDEAALALVETISLIKDGNNIIEDASNLMAKWSLEALNMFLFGRRLGALGKTPNPASEQLIKDAVGTFRTGAILNLGSQLYKIFPTPMWRKFKRHADGAFAVATKMCKQKIEEVAQHQKNADSMGSKQSMLEYLLSKDKPLSMEEVVTRLSGMQLAATETTASTLALVAYLLALNPEKQQQLRDEVSSILNGDEPITKEQLDKLVYMKACLKEAMRIYPVAPMLNRKLNADLEILGYKLPKGTGILGNIYCLCRSPDIFPEPESFLPERWLRDVTPDMSVASLVFGHGARMCIGKRIAMQEMHTGLARLVQNYKISYPLDEPPELILGPALAMKYPMPLCFTPV